MGLVDGFRINGLYGVGENPAKKKKKDKEGRKFEWVRIFYDRGRDSIIYLCCLCTYITVSVAI
jgi:hypothetical protein